MKRPTLRDRLRHRARAMDAWSKRAGRFVGPTDLLHAEPFHVLATMVRFLNPAWRDTEWSGDLDGRDGEFVDVVLDAVRELAHRGFSLKVEGIEHVPAEGPALVVANHNGGILPLDALFTLLAIRDHLGVERELNMLGHDLLGSDEVGRRLFTKLGIIRADPSCAAEALRRGRLVLVYPSSEHDSWRPWSERNRIVLGGRTGFLRLALREGVPIVPLVTAGTHEQLVVLSRGRRLARALRLKRLIRAEAVPIVFALPWGVTLGYVPYLPIPAQTTLRFGPPLAWPDLCPDDAADPDVLDRCLRQVRDTMQDLLDELYIGRVPIIGDRLG